MATAGRDEEDRRILKTHVNKHYAGGGNFHEKWRNLPEIPTSSEIMPTVAAIQVDNDLSDGEDLDEAVDEACNGPLPSNPLIGAWASKKAYVGTHYRLLREDAVGPLRNSVAFFKEHPTMQDDGDTCVYTSVYFKGLQVSNQGVGFRVEFSYERAGKRIRWEQSKRLQQGTLLAMSPQRDCFKSVCKLVTVAARPIRGGLDQNPPSVDLFWANPEEAEFQPGEPWIMVESRQGYYEASRHMLVALQKVMTEDTPLQDYILTPQQNETLDAVPNHLKEQSIMDLSSLITTTVPPEEQKDARLAATESSLDFIDVLKEIPEIPMTGLDYSQKIALNRMLANRLAIVQGPPGTGKTFVSVAALIVLIDNLKEGDPPIVVAAQTNHALDQLLNHILLLKEDILRLGGRSDRENTEIQKRTMYELRQSCKEKAGGKGLRFAINQLKSRLSDFTDILEPFLKEDPITDEILRDFEVLTKEQFDSLRDETWVEDKEEELNGSKLLIWLGIGNLVPLDHAPAINMGLEEEAIDLEFEQLQELELENGEPPEPDDADALRGTWVPFTQRWTGRQSGRGLTEKKIRKIKQKLSKTRNLWDILPEDRGDVYRFLLKELYSKVGAIFRGHLRTYSRELNDFRIARDMVNLSVVRNKKIKLVGCTTTGLSKYRPFLAALKPLVLLIEEAAETLEGTVTAGLFESLEQLILVGDHKQLQANCNNQVLQKAPYNLGKSMFERLITNDISYIMLQRQRRMIPDIRKLLCMEEHSIYPELKDHPSVLDRVTNRKPVEGMGGCDTFFFHHQWSENRDNDASRYNLQEAEMIANFFLYLVFNGVPVDKITILTFYNGQRKTILKQLRKLPVLRGETYFNVFTVDSYQGEENDIVLLSLVRSNAHLGIGFLENQNRLVVSLSRARRGLYIFGNAVTLAGADEGHIWTLVFKTMITQGHATYVNADGSPGSGLPITCQKHGNTTEMFEPDDWVKIQGGGCPIKCSETLSCGHACPITCHPFTHDRIVCKEECSVVLECGHTCTSSCGALCCCVTCRLESQEQIQGSTSDSDADLSNLLALRNINTQAKVSRGSKYIEGNKTMAQTMNDAAKSWQAYDPKQHDKELGNRRLEDRTTLMNNSDSGYVITETFRPAVIQNGVRLEGKGRQKIVYKAGTVSKGTPSEVNTTASSSSGFGKQEIVRVNTPTDNAAVTISPAVVSSSSENMVLIEGLLGLDITTNEGKTSADAGKISDAVCEEIVEDLISFD
ncbi:helicase required for RNAi-mediated heterochromatin assembly 1 [Phlyctema vagabunda]|uniref:Helicase required for RNAi-mediated heterochromatin assembly 1 n=1 Tax=Phlyctema vagabunda TaxID=108571 RepID=A0ABR4PH45_9HELO